MIPVVLPSGVLPGGVIPVRDVPAEREPRIELGWPGLESNHPSMVALNLDSSGSVIAPQGNDPIGNRFNEARRAIKLVADWTYTSRSKVAVLHFDHPLGASGVVPLNDRRLLRRLNSSLQNPGGRGTSDLLPSLNEMEKLALAHPEHDFIGVIVSDFELTDVSPAEVFTRLRGFPGRIHAVVLGGNVPLDLVGADNITMTPLSVEDPPGAFAAALHRSLTATRVAARHSLLHGPHAKQVLS